MSKKFFQVLVIGICGLAVDSGNQKILAEVQKYDCNERLKVCRETNCDNAYRIGIATVAGAANKCNIAQSLGSDLNSSCLAGCRFLLLGSMCKEHTYCD